MTPFVRGLLVGALLATTWGCRRNPLAGQRPEDASVVGDAAQDLTARTDALDGRPDADGPSNDDGPSDADDGPSTSPPPRCPEGLKAPFPGSVCTRGAICACGDDPRPECESIATCKAASSGSSADVWQVLTPTCAPLPPSVCPAAPLEARNQPCTPHGADCVYPGSLHCYCLTSGEITWSSAGKCGRPPLLWYCGLDDGPGGCPDGVPEVGTACAPDGLVCGVPLQPCFNSFGRQCTGAIWQMQTHAGECI